MMNEKGIRLAIILAALFLGAGCGPALTPQPPSPLAQPAATLAPVPPTPTPSPATEAELLVNAWISAWESRDATKLMSLYDDKAEWMDMADPSYWGAGPSRARGMESEFRSLFYSPEFKVKIASYFVSADGRFATAQGTYTFWSIRGNVATASTVTILGFENGKIVRETWYYDGSLFY